MKRSILSVAISVNGISDIVVFTRSCDDNLFYMTPIDGFCMGPYSELTDEVAEMVCLEAYNISKNKLELGNDDSAGGTITGIIEAVNEIGVDITNLYGHCDGCNKGFGKDEPVMQICEPWKSSKLHIEFCKDCEPPEKLKEHYAFSPGIVDKETEVDNISNALKVFEKYPQFIGGPDIILSIIATRKEEPKVKEFVEDMLEFGMITKECVDELYGVEE